MSQQKIYRCRYLSQICNTDKFLNRKKKYVRAIGQVGKNIMEIDNVHIWVRAPLALPKVLSNNKVCFLSFKHHKISP